MNSHKNARTTFEGRKLLIERIAVMGLSPAASAAGVSERTARKWLGRFAQHGVDGLLDRTSRPNKTRSTVDAALLQRIEQLRRARMPMRTIAAIVGRSVSTVSRVLARLGLSSLKALDPALPILRYEREAPGELLHMDTKKLGRIVRPSHRVTGNRRDSVEGAGWEFAHVAIDDHSRAGFVQMHGDERKDSAVAFLRATVAHCLGREDQAPADRQRAGVSIPLVRSNLPGYGDQAYVHTAIPAPNKRQSRALHPDLPQGMGLRPDVAEQRRAHRLAARLPGLLQRPPTTLGPRL
jgi:transposase